MSKRIFVGNLSFEIDSVQLKKLFIEFGRVEEALVILDRKRNVSKGYGFVTMSTEEEAQEAINKLHGMEIDERIIRVEMAAELPESTPRKKKKSAYVKRENKKTFKNQIKKGAISTKEHESELDSEDKVEESENSQEGIENS